MVAEYMQYTHNASHKWPGSASVQIEASVLKLTPELRLHLTAVLLEIFSLLELLARHQLEGLDKLRGPYGQGVGPALSALQERGERQERQLLQSAPGYPLAGLGQPVEREAQRRRLVLHEPRQVQGPLLQQRLRRGYQVQPHQLLHAGLQDAVYGVLGGVTDVLLDVRSVDESEVYGAGYVRGAEDEYVREGPEGVHLCQHRVNHPQGVRGLAPGHEGRPGRGEALHLHTTFVSCSPLYYIKHSLRQSKYK